MKKSLLVLIVSMLVLLGGCCTVTAPDGTSTKSMSNCFKTVATTICNPPADAMAVASSALTLAEAVLAVTVPGSAAYVAALGAYGSANAIQSGLCVGVTQLSDLIAFIESPSTKAAQMKMAKGKKAAATIDTMPLKMWLASMQ